jgi:phosphate transport system substrate-binding protein
VKAVPLATGPNATCVPAEPAFAYTGEYPLARFLYVYINHQPGSQLDPLRAEFIKYVFSKQGQEDVVKDGYFPVSHTIAVEQLSNVGIK